MSNYRYLNHRIFCLLAGGLMLLAGCESKKASPFSESAVESLSGFTLEPGFKIELVASEPLITDPVAMEIDENGLMYVVQMPGYPLDVSASGLIKTLKDTDGDGKMDESRIFADNLLFPTGIMRWNDGILVTDPPNVLYLEDSDNDGKADVRDTVLTGFAVSNPSHIVNQPLLGIDNWIYVANDPAISTVVYAKEFGDRGREITFPGVADSPRLPQNASGRSLRFRPGEKKIELLSSKTQFGHTFDAWGNYFTVNNSNHAMHEVISATYLNRNPDLLVSDAIQSLSDHGNASEVFPTTRNPELQMLTNVGVITSACGLTAYLGGAFPPDYNDDVLFVAEPVSNLLHVDKLKSAGATFTASRMRERKEFLTSTDAWFRPVYLYIGPDGGLYVVDYYRRIIEHPEYMSDEVNKSGTLYDGSDKGRIYRIVAADAPAISWTKKLDLSKFSNEELIEKLADKNIWWRKNAQRLLLDRGADSDVAALLAMTKRTDSSLGRLHALWTLEGLGKLTSEQIRIALKDPEPGVRKNAIKLCELHLSDDPTLATDLLALKDDADPKVRFQLLCALGFVQSSDAVKAREELLLENIEDAWMQLAALSAPSAHTTGLMDAAIKRFETNVTAYASLVQKLASMAGASLDRNEIHKLISRATNLNTSEAWQASILEGLAQGLRGKNDIPFSGESDRKKLVQCFFSHTYEPARKGSLHMLQVVGLPDGTETQAAFGKAIAIASNRKASPDRRAEAIEFMALKDPRQFESLLKSLIVTGEALPVQAAAFRTLSKIPDVTVSKYVLERWESLTPELRDVALNTFLASPERVNMLLDAIEQNKISKSSVGFNRSVRLRVHSDVPIRNRARMLFAENDNTRSEVISKYEEALTLTGSAENGKIVFEKNCASCHQIRGEFGVAFGPDLGTVHNWPPADLISNILDPNRSISDGFDLWEVTLNDGDIVQGIISSETPNALSVRNAAGQETVVARTDIKSINAVGVSAMPNGLEGQIDVEQMSDLLAFLKRVE